MDERQDVPDRPATASHSRADFDAAYLGVPPWDIDRPQPAFEALAASGALTGKVLDVGCGTGEHAIMAAVTGLEAMGVDTALRAIDRARKKAEERHVLARFEVWDALELPELGERFDTVLDCGLFHVFSDEDRPRFAASLAAVVPSGGRYFMLCFSDRQPGDWGPRRVSQAEIRAEFSEGWQVDAIEPTVIDITIDPNGARAWLASITRR
jgi:SAM-dependent methyltransferase